MPKISFIFRPKYHLLTSHKSSLKKISFWEAFNLYTHFASNLKGKTNKNRQHSKLACYCARKIDNLICLNLVCGKKHISVQPKNIASTLKAQVISHKKYHSFSREVCQTLLQVNLVVFIDTVQGQGAVLVHIAWSSVHQHVVTFRLITSGLSQIIHVKLRQNS